MFNDLNIKWQSIYHHFQKFSRANVFKNVYLKLLNRYFKINRSGKLKYLTVDTSFLKNHYASNVAFNGYCKKKRLSKLSLVVDSNGVPISALIAPGNFSDQKLLFRNWNNLFVEIKQTKRNNKHKRYLLADAIYNTIKIRSLIEDKNITPIIAFNKRNTHKDARKLTKLQKSISRKRMIVENAFSWIYQNRRIVGRFDKIDRNYLSFLFMALTKILLRRL